MAIEYSKVGWDVAPYKYANPDNMNKMDTGIKSAVDGVNALEYVPSALEEIKMLGWSTPTAMSVRNYVDSSRNLHVRVGRVDLGTLNWVQYGGHFYNYGGISYKTTANSVPFNGYTSKYTTVSFDYLNAQSGDKCVGATNDGYLCIRDTSYSDATALRNAVSGTYLYYELGTSVEIAEGNEIGILRYADVTISASSVPAYSDVRATVTVPSGYTAISVVSLTNNNAEFVPYLRKVSDTAYAIIVRNTTASTLSYQANTYRVVMARL